MLILVTNTLLFKTPCPQGVGKMLSNDGKFPKLPPLVAVPANKSATPPKPCCVLFWIFSLTLLQVQAELSPY
jgi:hypothetical protein